MMRLCAVIVLLAMVFATLAAPARAAERALVLDIDGAIGPAVAGLIGLVGVLDLDHLGAQHSQLVRGEGPGQHASRRLCGCPRTVVSYSAPASRGSPLVLEFRCPSNVLR